MENKKFIIALIGAFIFFAIFIYVGIKSPSINLLGLAPPEKIIEFKNTRVVGWGDGHKLWEIMAEEIWSTKNRNITTFEHVKDGIVYKNGRPIVKNLKARRVKYHRWSRKIEAFGILPEESGEKRNLDALVDIENITSEEAPFREQRFVRLEADRIEYNPDSERAQAQGNVVIFEKGFNIHGERMEIKGRANIANISGGVRITKDDTKISGKEMVADFKGDTYTISGDVEITQKEKAAVGEVAILDGKSGEIKLEKNVRFLIEKGTALIEEEALSNLRNPEAKEILKGKTLLRCEVLKLSTKGKNAEASGVVEITQQEKRAKSDKAIYERDSETIVLTGNVFIEKGNEWIKAQKVVVSVSEESFEAIGKVEAEFKIE